MAIITALHHVTCYTYDRPVQLGPQCIRLRPAPHTRSPIRSFSLTVNPSEHFLNWQQDPFGNHVARLVFPKPTREFRVEVDLLTEMTAYNPLDFFLEEETKEYPFVYEPELRVELAPYLELVESGRLLQDHVARFAGRRLGMVDFLVELNQTLNEELSYLIRLEPGVQSCEETLTLRRGSCRDMAWLLCQTLRHLGMAARFASGYLIQLKQDIKSLDGPSGPEDDFTDLHAWTEIYLPGAGWIGLDPTSGLFAGEGHIPLSCTPNPSSAAPISGKLSECQSSLTHEMRVTRVSEDPRITRPLAEEQWSEILNLADEVEADLQSEDVRLTMGGEPTFVSLDDPEGDEWNFSALGKAKFTLGDALLWRLKPRFTEGAVIQYSQGKWYPGEELPRWAMNCHARLDGVPVWKNEALLARPGTEGACDAAAAKQFTQQLAQALGISATAVQDAYEDSTYHRWKQTKQPSATEGQAPPKTRQEPNSDRPVGYVLPLRFSARRKQWISSPWRFGSGRLVLSPGDSPLGLRLPLDQLPQVEEAEKDCCPERSAFEQEGTLPSRQALQALNRSSSEKHGQPLQEPMGFVRTALCVECRENKLHIFLPPLTLIEHFLALLVAIEEIADQQGIPVVLEGYAPPNDLRMRSFSVTPDPGVLEVNMPPADSWRQLKEFTQALYDEARTCRLATEKYLIDGRQVGTGGGNHIVVGGAHPLNSPFLRRPDLLRSMVAFWQNHPSLSYLFSAQYIGPTSQAPRIDEARHDSLYELELAFEHIPDEGSSPWLVDRLFRHLLVDLTGNTHRAEFCIDKLFNPDSLRGRLGLLELRGFEMTPHARMNLLQALLVRALIACFWKRPYLSKLVPWGTSLHDKFMLPEYVWSDLEAVLSYLTHEGYAFRLEWFLPFLEFRFPKYGIVELGDMSLEIRQALEPWPVLGEEVQRAGVSRAVDSSVERLQVKTRGVVEGRHVVTCNGYRLPLQAGRERGARVAGVRFKAWAPPLVFTSDHPRTQSAGF